MSEIELWTLQDPGVLDTLARTGYLCGDGRRADRDFRPAYRWLMKQMGERLPGYRGGHPVWAWLEKPDMRRHPYCGFRGEDQVRIGFRVPRSRVLVHEYDSWHSVLNGQPLTLNEAEWDASDAWSREQVERSWERIFDAQTLASSDPDWRGTGPFLMQATVEHVEDREIFHRRLFRALKNR